MNNLLSKLIQLVISTILGTIAGTIIPILMFGREQIVIDGKQLNFDQIHLQQSIIIRQSREREMVVGQRCIENDDLGVFIYILGAMLLVYGFLNFQTNIKMTMAIAMLILEAIFWITAYLIIKNNMIDKKIRGILLFNILSAIYIPVIIYLLENSVVVKNINVADILLKMQQQGAISILLEPEKFGFVLYQAIGVFTVFAYMVVVLLGTIHVLAMLNLALEGKGQRIFGWIYRKSYWIVKSFTWYLTCNIILLVISMIFVLGIPTLIFRGIIM